MKTTPSRKAALTQARAEVSEIYRFGDGWRFSEYDHLAHAWRETQPAAHQIAQHRRSVTIAARFAALIGYDALVMEYQFQDSHQFPTLASMLNACRP